MISDEELQRLTDLEASATPGEWESQYAFSAYFVYPTDGPGNFVPDSWVARARDGGNAKADAAFIAESRNVFSELLTEVKELRAWANRMPDAGLTVDDPRYAWWIERPCK